jgi:hypothetical protein
VALELKIGPFEPAFAGQMDFYLNLLNEREKGGDDMPSIGVILCAEKDNLEVEFSTTAHSLRQLPVSKPGSENMSAEAYLVLFIYLGDLVYYIGTCFA